MVESGKTTLSSQIVHLPDTPTNFHRPSTSRSTKLAKSLNPSPKLLQRGANPVRFCQSRIKDICLFYPPSFIPIPPLQVFFQDFPLQFPPPPMSKVLVGVWNKSSETWIPSKNQVSLRSDHPFVRWKYPNFHIFQEFRFPPPTAPNVTGSGRNLKLEL